MSIPLDRLYHYIESVANEVSGNTIIYRFNPHGSKKIEDLTKLIEFENPAENPLEYATRYPIYCHDQEPLNFDLYRHEKSILAVFMPKFYEFAKNDINFYRNLIRDDSIYDQAILLHSEKNSLEVKKYQETGLCIPVYYWSHAVIAQDWFRYARYVNFNNTSVNKRFLIYNRSWSGSREYRLKFTDLLIDYDLVKDSNTSVSYECNGHYYKDYTFQNANFKINNTFENFVSLNNTTSCYSADFNITDYHTTGIEVVLETLFDDQRIHLTEKILRPIACEKPFILASTPGALSYLRDYGFKTFGDIIDENYDTVTDPISRLTKIINVMQEIQSWNESTFAKNYKLMKSIAHYNKQYFFSNKFKNLIFNELQENLSAGIKHIENTNLSIDFIHRIKFLLKYHQSLNNSTLDEKIMFNDGSTITKDYIIKMLTKAHSYNQRQNKY